VVGYQPPFFMLVINILQIKARLLVGCLWQCAALKGRINELEQGQFKDVSKNIRRTVILLVKIF